jgi:hypothetical protein
MMICPKKFTLSKVNEKEEEKVLKFQVYCVYVLNSSLVQSKETK